VVVPDAHDVERLRDDEKPDDTRPPEEIDKDVKRQEARSRAEVLEMLGDLPHADAKPPDNVLFVCKLNPVTKEEDLRLIFSQFGDIKDCSIIRDWKTGDSLQYAFIEFANNKECEKAFSKMENVLIDDRRIHVDFSQSVAHLWGAWRKSGKAGLQRGQFNETGKRNPSPNLQLKQHQQHGTKREEQRFVSDRDIPHQRQDISRAEPQKHPKPHKKSKSRSRSPRRQGHSHDHSRAKHKESRGHARSRSRSPRSHRSHRH